MPDHGNALVRRCGAEQTLTPQFTMKANSFNFVLILAMVAFTAMAYGTVHQPVIALFYVLVAVLVVSWAYQAMAAGSAALDRSALQLPLYLLAIYAFIQIVPFGSFSAAGLDNIPRTLSISPFDTELAGVHIAVAGILFSMMLVSLDRAERLRKAVTFLVLFGFAFAFFAILQSFLSPTRIFGIYERPSPFGTFVNRHNFAAYMEMTIAVPLGMLMAGAVERDRKLLFITAIGIMAVALLLSGSRGGLIALVASVALAAFLSTRRHGKRSKLIRFGLLAAIAAIVVGGTLLIGGESSFTRISDTASSGDISTNRTQIWDVTLKVIRENLPFGAGIGAFGQAYTKFDEGSGLERVEQAHNDYLQAAADAGIVGLLIGGSFLWLLWRQGRIGIASANGFRRGVAIGAAAGIFAILVHSLFDFVLHTTAVTVLFLLLVALLVAAGKKFRDDVPDIDRGRRERSRSNVRMMRR